MIVLFHRLFFITLTCFVFVPLTSTIAWAEEYLDDGVPLIQGDENDDSKTVLLKGIIRDFTDEHVDFESALGAEEGIVAEDIGSDDKPVYAGDPETLTTHGEEAFNQWYRDVPGINKQRVFPIRLITMGNGLYTYNNQSFFPIDDELYGNQGRKHNYHFTYEIHSQFTYRGGEIFRFTGDDDLWVYINGKLAIDIGGVHSPLSETADLDALADYLNISIGNTYSLDFFFAERHTAVSTFHIETSITDLSSVGGDHDSDGDGVPDTEDNCPNSPEDVDGELDDDGCPDKAGDQDGDGIPDEVDDCPTCGEDIDGNADDDGCPETSGDRDGDAVPDSQDNCPKMHNPDQSDSDNNGIGDACEGISGVGATGTGALVGCSAASSTGNQVSGKTGAKLYRLIALLWQSSL